VDYGLQRTPVKVIGDVRKSL